MSRPINELSNIYGQLQTALAAAERIFLILNESPEDRSGSRKVMMGSGVVDFHHIDFSYNGSDPVLRDFTLHIPSGKKVALVGATGSGKTTVVNLLLRFYRPNSGCITVDGEDILDIDSDVLRRNIAIVLQDTTLFTDTIRSNILDGNPDGGEPELKKAAAVSGIEDIIDRLGGSYDTIHAEAGSTLSQGQRQLLAISRAFASDPRILILDEATSSIDTRTEKKIQDAMHQVMKDRTSIIIAHRLSTIRDADLIVVMDSGHIIESGRHEELLAKKGTYYSLYNSQFAGFAT